MTDIAKLVLDTDTRGLKTGEKALDSISSKAGQISQNIGKSLQGLGTRLSIGVTAPLALFGKQAIQSATDFRSSMSDVSTLVDTNVESLEAMSDQVLEISKRTPVALNDLTGALFDVRSAGIDAADAMDVLEQSARLGVAGLGSTKEATDLVTSAINAFNIDGAEQAQIYDTIFKATKNGKTTISELSQNFGAVAGTVSKAGIELDEYLASVAALTTTGLPAAQAHTQIRAAIAGLTRETELSRSVFQGLGAKDFPDLIEKSGGMVNALDLISGQLGNNDADIIKLVGSVEAYNAIVGLTGGQNEAFTATLDDMRSGIDGVNEAFDKQDDTPEARAQRTKNAMEDLSITVGSALLPAVEKLTDFLTGVADAFAGLDEDTQTFIVGAGLVLAALGPLALVFGSLLTIAPALVTAFGLISGAIGFLFANPIILGAAALIGGIYLAWKNWDKIEAIVVSVGDAISAWWSETISPIFDAVGGKIDEVIGYFDNIFGAGISRVVGFVKQLITGDFAGAWDSFKSIVKDGLNALGTALLEVHVKIGETFVDIASSMIGYGKDIISGLISGIKAAPQAVWNALKSVVGFGVDSVKNFLGINSPSKLFMEFGGFVTDGLAIGITNGTPDVKRAADNMAAAVGQSVDGVQARLASIGVNNATPEAEFGNELSDINSDIAPTFASDVSNPLLQEVDRISQGFADMARDVESNVKGLVSSFKDGDFLGIVTGVADTIGGLFSKDSNGKSVFGSIKSIFKSFDGGGFTGGGSRSGGLDGKGGFMAMLHPQETVIDHSRGQQMQGGQTVIINNSALADAYVDNRAANVAAPMAEQASTRGATNALSRIQTNRRKQL